MGVVGLVPFSSFFFQGFCGREGVRAWGGEGAKELSYMRGRGEGKEERREEEN